jgi:protease IV
MSDKEYLLLSNQKSIIVKKDVMKQFFKFLLAAILGTMLALLLMFFIFVGVISSIGKKGPRPVASNSVYHLELKSQIIDREPSTPIPQFDFMNFGTTRPIGLNELLKSIKKAGEDDNIKGIFLDLYFTQAGMSTLSEIRHELLAFKQSGKFIVAYGDVMSQGAYYLASVADEIYINPQGTIDFRGLNSQIMFMKRMLDKIGVEVDVIRHGKFKSAGEPFFLEKLSEENRAQTQAYVSSLWNTILKDIADTRNIGINELNQFANTFITRTPEGALESRLIDGIAYRDEVMDNLRAKLELKEKDKVNLVDYPRYRNTPMPDNMNPAGKRNKIAVIYGSGGITMGKGADGSMGAEKIAEALRTARRDSTVKAIVFRINSPGGSALASEIMLREAMLAKDVKPLVVSMGDVAASGGYYVAAYASKIIAHPNTITGSIGVFGIVPNMQELLNDKLGLTFDNVQTNDLSDLGSLNRPLRRHEREIIQNEVDRIYMTFVNHVAQGRGLTYENVDEMAQGRVWSGVDAQRLGLVDEFGGLEYAIEQAAALAGVDNYRVVEYPIEEDFFTRLMESMGNMEARIIKNRLGETYTIYQTMQQLNEQKGIMMRMPYDIVIE